MAEHSRRDTLLIDDLQVEAVVGVFAWEREIEQELRFNVELDLDMSAAAASDDVADAVSYVDVAELIAAHTQQLAPQLLEHLAERLSDALFQQFPIEALRLRVSKPTALANANVAVAISRTRAGD